ncbi:glycosyltransferase [Crocinitomicaceae bacterium]|nr:glycosyltransferase [Crocinitomicaceae bacterium]MDB3907612.1 glycosyltransferase [Crocinitomicaceae bacterium]
MQEHPLVSIVMAVKDTAPYLHACLDSIIAQTYQNWELIAVNDHSSDSTPQILKEYAEKDARIRYFDSDQHRLIATLQVGYRHVRGTLLNRMDSDDKMPHDKIETLVNEWQKYGKGHVIAGGTEHFVDEGEVGDGFLKYENWLNNVAANNLHYQEIYRECVIPSHCWMLHKDDFDAVGAFDPVIYPEDYDLCFRMYRHELKVIGIDKILHHWRDRSNRISRTWDEYKDNRYYDMKLRFFFELDRDSDRPLVVWGAGRNGKDLVKGITVYENGIEWVCDNEKKIGKDIYDIRMRHFSEIPDLDNPQILIAIASPDAKNEIEEQLRSWGKNPIRDYWFFS